MKVATTIWSDGNRRWLALARDPARTNHLIDTNELVMDGGGECLITDPGGFEIFPAVFAALTSEVDPARIAHVFASHQDPDVISSLALWLEVLPGLKCYASWLWCSFIPHFGGTRDTFVPVADEGASIEVGGRRLEVLPAHYLHSSGNLHLYDPAAKLLFSGDVGAALLPPGEGDLYVSSFDRHIRHAEGFHRRWMGSPAAKRAWCERVARLPIDFLCPQHGAVYRGKDVERFINWFDELEVGVLRPAAR